MFSYGRSVSFLLRNQVGEVRLKSKLSTVILKWFFKLDIGPGFNFGDNLHLPHPFGIVVAGGSQVGNNVTIGQNVTIGGNFKKYRVDNNGNILKHPRIGSNVWIASGAVVAGPIKIGNHVIIGANSVITKDIPDGTMVSGNNIIIKKDIVLGNGEYSESTTPGQ